MNKLVKTLGIPMILGLSIFFMGCGNANNIKSTTSPNKESTAKEVADEEKPVKLDKENAINVGYEKDDDYKDIMNLFDKNQLQANDKYLNKTLKITSEVNEIKTNNGQIIIYVSTESKFYGTDLVFENTKENQDKIKNLKLYDDSKGYKNVTRGDVITVYGYFENYNQYTGTIGEKMKITHCEFADK